MAAKGTRVKNNEIQKMYQLYEELGTFAKVAKRMRRDRATVAKYVAIYEAELHMVNVMNDTQK